MVCVCVCVFARQNQRTKRGKPQRMRKLRLTIEQGGGGGGHRPGGLVKGAKLVGERRLGKAVEPLEPLDILPSRDGPQTAQLGNHLPAVESVGGRG